MGWIDGDATEPSTVRDANYQPARLDTLRSRNSAAYKGIHVLIQRLGAKDWFWKSTIRELDSEKHEYEPYLALETHEPGNRCLAAFDPDLSEGGILILREVIEDLPLPLGR